MNHLLVVGVFSNERIFNSLCQFIKTKDENIL